MRISSDIKDRFNETVGLTLLTCGYSTVSRGISGSVQYLFPNREFSLLQPFLPSIPLSICESAIWSITSGISKALFEKIAPKLFPDYQPDLAKRYNFQLLSSVIASIVVQTIFQARTNFNEYFKSMHPITIGLLCIAIKRDFNP